MSKYATQLGNTANETASNAFNKAENTTQKYINKAENSLEDIEGKAYKIAEQIGSSLKEWLDTNGKRAAEVKDTAQETIKSHPLASTLAAFAGGWIIASLLSSGKR
ncbi:MAG TPA: hypothetical protein VGF14_05060 [Alphaproteobacteria bacterium]